MGTLDIKLFPLTHSMCVTKMRLCCWAAQFEGALGRLTTASIHNPRQIINVHIAPGSETDETRGVEVKRFKEFLLHIEKVTS